MNTSWSADSNIKIIIVDDHQVVIDGIQAMLESSPVVKVVATANNGKDALQYIRIFHPDLVLMDINMPGMDGIETTKIIVKHHPSIAILMLSMLKEQSMIQKALDNGARGYVLKNEGRDELIKAIKAVYRGEKYLSEGIHAAKVRDTQSDLPKISRREKQVLQLIVDEHTGNEIAEKLFISINTVDAHRKNLLMKLDVRNTAGLVKMAIKHKLVK